MSVNYQDRSSDSPFVENIGWSRAERDGFSILPADDRCYLFLMRQDKKVTLGVGGPLTKVLPLPVTAGTEFFGVRFKLGIFMPHLPVKNLVDNVTFLPEAANQSFWLHGSTWQYPDYENVETFLNRLIKDDLLVRDPVVGAVVQDQPHEMSLRTVQRRFLQATGLTPGTVRQIERARLAVTLLQQGRSILDTVYEAGYFDQPHLTRSLKRYVGQTPGEIAAMSQP